jgi:hypothetical protein
MNVGEGWCRFLLLHNEGGQTISLAEADSGLIE